MEKDIKQSEQSELRKKTRKELLDSGVFPYGRAFERSPIREYLGENFVENKKARVAGRIRAKRGHGKTLFADLYDRSGKAQIYIRKDSVPDKVFNIAEKTDIGDIIGVEGKLFKTKTGEVTILAESVEMLAKALHPLPEKWHGLKDIETRYRQRYLDLMVNSEVKDIFIKRSAIIKSLRDYLDSRGFIEVETPMMQNMAGGATAKPFKTHHNALGIDLYLRIAPELFLKRLLVGGFEKVYEINRNFRNEGISRRHNPEFTMLEVYEAYSDFSGMMELAEELIVDVHKKVNGNNTVKYNDTEIILDKPWKRISLIESVKNETGIDFLSEKDFAGKADGLGVKIEAGMSKWEVINKVFEHAVEPKLIQPTFIVDYPSEMCPLSKVKKDNPEIAERFELFIAGQELANAYSELNDPVEQEARFLDQAKGDRLKVDIDYVKSLEYGMPPAGGLGIGIDRLIMVLTSKESIRDVILFPQLKPEA
ncbi:lysine--tRNA ligase [bacterium]|jgi:lysyl-tRNA synthetase class 2|nr:lysine--tRNA ligase [bacterium]